MNTIETIKEQYRQLQAQRGNSRLGPVEQTAFEAFDRLGIPTVRHEEWKYTRIGSLFNKEFLLNGGTPAVSVKDLEAIRLPGFENANEIVFVNGQYHAALSTLRSASLVVLPLAEAAAGEYSELVAGHLGHSSRYIKDGIHALNTAFLEEGVFVQVKKGKVLEHPVYIYNIADCRSANILAQPRSLIHAGVNSQGVFAETYATIGAAESFTNQVIEFVVERDAVVEYYKIQNDVPQSSQVSTTHFRQVGKSTIHTVTISLNGGIVRNNLNVALEDEYAEAHLYGLYFLRGQTHVDHHTVVDHMKPNCPSNELYKGVIDDAATAVFNGKIFVQPQAQKTNAFQSNKNILLSDRASVNTKPQLEIFADDVKCSHGCTIGQLDEEALFYLRSRGVSKDAAQALLVRAFALDILSQVKLEPLREFIDGLISERLES